MISLTLRSYALMTLEGRGFVVAFLPGKRSEERHRTDGRSSLGWFFSPPALQAPEPRACPCGGTASGRGVPSLLCVARGGFPRSSLCFPSPPCCSCCVSHRPVPVAIPSFWVRVGSGARAVLLRGSPSAARAAAVVEQRFPHNTEHEPFDRAVPHSTQSSAFGFFQAMDNSPSLHCLCPFTWCNFFCAK